MTEKQALNNSKSWLILALSALGLACLLAIVLVFSRLPGLGHLYSSIATFHTALVLHVNLSLFVWLFSFSALIWSYFYQLPFPFLARLSFISCSLGVLLMLATAIFFEARPILSNYLPILEHSWYLTALKLFIAGFVVLILQVLFASTQNESIQKICPCCLKIIALAFLLAIITALIVAYKLPKDLLPFAYYELLFWGSGHQMQIIYTLIMLWSWLWLSQQAGTELPFANGTIRNWFIIALIPVIIALVGSITISPESSDYKAFFTDLMVYGSWIALPYLGGKLLFTLLSQKASVNRSIILLSMGLFVLGLLIGSQIQHNNLMIPGHYHALTGAINISLMLLTYHLMPALGFTLPSPAIQFKQLLLYSFGVSLLAAGLAWSGALGMARKTLIANINSLEQIFSLGLMGLGGLLSLLGCFLFLGISFRNMGIFTKKSKKNKPLPILNKVTKENVL